MWSELRFLFVFHRKVTIVCTSVKKTKLKLFSNQRFFSYIYTDKLDDDYADLEELYSTSDKYQMVDLKQRCENVFCKKLNFENAIQVFQLANLHLGEELKQTSAKFIWQNFGHIENIQALDSSAWHELYKLTKQMNDDEMKKMQ